jgi:GT2 family glycosyltransferase
MCNIGAKNAEGDYLLFLNDDITADNGQWIEYMLSKAVEKHCGAVGIKLLYPDKKTIQHCGVALFPNGPVHLLQGLSDDENYAFGRNRYTYNCIAVTAAAMMVSKQKFTEVGGFDEELSVAYNDVELCLKLYEKGWYNVNIAETYLIHHESATRGNDLLSEQKLRRLDKERELLYNKHFMAENEGYDVFYPQAYSRRTVDFELRF